MDVLNEYLSGKGKRGEHNRPSPRLVCTDGFNMSVQASEYTYCSPRENNAFPYSSVEVGYPSEREEALMPYAEDDDKPAQTVYGYVPVAVVLAIIEKHGGIA